MALVINILLYSSHSALFLFHIFIIFFYHHYSLLNITHLLNATHILVSLQIGSTFIINDEDRICDLRDTELFSYSAEGNVDVSAQLGGGGS